MQIFRYKADIIPALVIIALSIADFTVFFTAKNQLLVAIWAFVGIWPKACICSWNHHHQHVPTFLHTPLNRFMDLIYAFHTGITTNTWVLNHVLGHHVNYLDQEKDESAWMRKDGTKMGTIEYTLSIALTGYTRAFKVGKKHPKFQKTFLSMGFLTAALLIGMFFINWYNALLIFALPMLIGYIITCWHTYYHHAGLETDDHLEASYNTIHKSYNILTGNLGYHTAHHSKQALHWSKLPEYHEKIKDGIPQHLYRKPCFPFTLMPA